MIPIDAVVTYDNQGDVRFGVVVDRKNQKYVILNDKNEKVHLPESRLCLIGVIDCEFSELIEKTSKVSINTEEIWELCDDKEVTAQELAKELFKSPKLAEILALRIALCKDKVFFKRNGERFSPRPKQAVEILKEEAKRAREKEEQIALFVRWLNGEALNPNKELLDDLCLFAADGSLPPNAHKEIVNILTSLSGRETHLCELARELLIKKGIFTHTTNLQSIKHKLPCTPIGGELGSAFCGLKREDLTMLSAFTIDDESTKDIDDAITLDKTEDGFLLGIHITDVASSLPCGSELDLEARKRATSVYLPETTFHMLPRQIAEDSLSLVANKIRKCLSVMVRVSRSGDLIDAEVKPTLIKVAKRLSYEEADRLIELGDPDLTFLDILCHKREEFRQSKGGFKVSKREVNPIVLETGEIQLQEYSEDTPSRFIVGELMILANSVFANFCLEHRLACPYRTQSPLSSTALKEIEATPEGLARDFALRVRLNRSIISMTPGVHATLGLSAYTQATSPIRRYTDIIVQRQILNFLEKEAAFYSENALAEILASLEEPLLRAATVTRESKRFCLLKYLKQTLGKVIEGVIVRHDDRITLIELDEVYQAFPIKGLKNPELGSRKKVVAKAVDPFKDYIRLEVVG
jgi:exoribonuclease-2